MDKHFDDGNGLRIKTTQATFDKMLKDLQQLARVEILVGFPEDTTARTEDSIPQDITNASLAYIHDNGAPEQNIPARPFMLPGIEAAKEKVTDRLGQTLRAVSQNKGVAVIEKGLTQTGLLAKLSIQNVINAGVPPPLADATLRNRARKGRKGAAKELESRGQGNVPGMADAKPLIDTGQLRNAVNYVIRDRSRRSK